MSAALFGSECQHCSTSLHISSHRLLSYAAMKFHPGLAFSLLAALCAHVIGSPNANNPSNTSYTTMA